MSDPNPSAGPVAPFGVITSTDRRGLILVITTLLLGFVLLCFAARIYTRIWVKGPWQRDDGVFAIACFFCCVESAVVYAQVSQGLGRSNEFVNQKHTLSISKIGVAVNFFYILGHYISKCSMALIFVRISPRRGHILASWAAIGGSVLFGVTSILLITIHCTPGYSWFRLSPQCPNLLARWDVVAAFDVLTEVVIFGISIYIVADLQMALSNKVKIVAVFALRLPIIAACLVRLHFVKRTLYSSDPTFTGALAAVWTQVELDYSIMAGALVYLGPVMQPFDNTYQTSRTPHTGSSNSYGLRSFTSKNSKGEKLVDTVQQTTKDVPTIDESELRGDRVTHTATISRNVKNDQHSIGSSDSRQMIIRKNLEWSVDRG